MPPVLSIRCLRTVLAKIDSTKEISIVRDFVDICGMTSVHDEVMTSDIGGFIGS
jgi:hypothetical protein